MQLSGYMLLKPCQLSVVNKVKIPSKVFIFSSMLYNKDKNFCFVYLAASKNTLLLSINFKLQFYKIAKF